MEVGIAPTAAIAVNEAIHGVVDPGGDGDRIAAIQKKALLMRFCHTVTPTIKV